MVWRRNYIATFRTINLLNVDFLTYMYSAIDFRKDECSELAIVHRAIARSEAEPFCVARDKRDIFP